MGGGLHRTGRGGQGGRGETLMCKSPGLRAKFWRNVSLTDMGENEAKLWGILHPFSCFNFQEKWFPAISRKVLCIFHWARNKSFSLRDSGSWGAKETLSHTHTFTHPPTHTHTSTQANTYTHIHIHRTAPRGMYTQMNCYTCTLATYLRSLASTCKRSIEACWR